MYPPNLTPRSGASMKFSFPPPNAEAARAFGADAFPSNGQMHVNGPAASPPLPQPIPQAPARRKWTNNNSTKPTPLEVRPSIETTTPKQSNGEAPHTNGDSKQKTQDVVNVEDDADTIQVKQEVRNTPVQQIPAIMPAATGFTAVNALPQKRQASASMPRPSNAGGGNAGAKKAKTHKAT
ncbi:hypothetical protein KC336_g20234 [Hortaea werneckii]|nr:hypothetical protein KC336_g20234 [Hortaea werneckii]